MLVQGREENKSIVTCDVTTISALKVSNIHVKFGRLAAQKVEASHEELVPDKCYSAFIHLLEHLGQ